MFSRNQRLPAAPSRAASKAALLGAAATTEAASMAAIVPSGTFGACETFPFSSRALTQLRSRRARRATALPATPMADWTAAHDDDADAAEVAALSAKWRAFAKPTAAFSLAAVRADDSDDGDAPPAVFSLAALRDGGDADSDDDAPAPAVSPSTRAGSSGSGAGPDAPKWACDACTFLNEPKDATCDVCDSPMPEAEAARLRDAAAPPPVMPLLAADPRLQQIPEPDAAAPKRKPRDALAQFLRRNAPPKKKRRARFFAA